MSSLEAHVRMMADQVWQSSIDEFQCAMGATMVPLPTLLPVQNTMLSAMSVKKS